MVSGGEWLAEEVEAMGDGAGERNHDARDGRAVRLAQVPRMEGDVRIVEQVGHDVLLDDLFPCLVILGGGGIGADAEKLLAQGKQRAVLVRVVDSEAGLDHRPVAVEAGQDAGQAAVAGGAGGGHRHAIMEFPERAGADDAIDQFLAGAGSEQAGFIIITLDGKIGVLGGEIV